MGLTDAEAAILRARLTPTTTTQAQAKPITITEDATIGNEERLRGIPAVGRISGTIKGTRPGDSAADLERSSQELRSALMAKARTSLRRT